MRCDRPPAPRAGVPGRGTSTTRAWRLARFGLAAFAMGAGPGACGGSADHAADRAAGRPHDAATGGGAVEGAAGSATAPIAARAVAGAAAQAAQASAQASADTATVTVYKSPTCGCCAKWVDHMRANGFRVVVHDTADVAPVRAAHGVTGLLAACHTALVGGYVVEGHVPAADVRRLLRERPPVLGIAAPGMPMGAPGMEGPYPSDRYHVLTFDRDGGGGVFARH